MELTFRADIQSKNILISTKNNSIFDKWEQSEQSEPSPRKTCGGHTVYRSRLFRRKKGWSRNFGMPLLSDFDEARIGDLHSGIVQPDIFRAPEVILVFTVYEKDASMGPRKKIWCQRTSDGPMVKP
jgi:serine/threonine-protein kinase SRPK3